MFFVTKIKTWLREHWAYITAFIMFCLFIVNGFWQKAITDSLAEENVQEQIRHTESIEQLQEIHRIELEEQRQLTTRLQADLARIENDYTRRISEIETTQDARRQTTVRQTTGNPNEMARRLQQRLGWRIEQ